MTLAGESEAEHPVSSPTLSAGDHRWDPVVLVLGADPAETAGLIRRFRSWGFRRVVAAEHRASLVGLCAEVEPDLIVLGLDGPAPDGLELIGMLRVWRARNGQVPLLSLGHEDDVAIRRQALAAGATAFQAVPFDDEEFRLRCTRLLQTREAQEDLRHHAELVERRVRERTRDVELAQVELLQRLARAAEYRDDVSGEHPERVAQGVRRLGTLLGCPEHEVALWSSAATVHDIGNIAIPDAILLKPGPLTAEEEAVMRTHVDRGVELLEGSTAPLLRSACEIVGSHHERWDGTGYPERLRGEDIPLSGRVVAVMDVFDALLHDRPYRPAFALPDAVDEIARLSGIHFDPAIVDAFTSLDHEADLLLGAAEAREASDGAAVARSLPRAHKPVRKLSLTAAASAVGVAPVTLRRWADVGRVPCDRTAGGHRRFSAEELRTAVGVAQDLADRHVVRPIPAPDHPLPAAARLVEVSGRQLVREAAAALYEGGSGWWTTAAAMQVTDPWLRALAGSLAGGDYEHAAAATLRLMDMAELAGASRLERHRFLQRFGELLARSTGRERVATRADQLGLQRLFISLHGVALDQTAPRTLPAPRSAASRRGSG